MLYIGANYHPHDWTEDRWAEDIRLMKEAGFTTVRLGHLCWDSYEPENGVYTFAWFDRVMDLFAEAGIGVVLDVSMHPAPLWVHRECPGCPSSRLSSFKKCGNLIVQRCEDYGFIIRYKSRIKRTAWPE